MEAVLRQRVEELAMVADEEGDNVSCVALLHVIKGTSLPPGVARRWVNTVSLMLETIEHAAAKETV